MISDLHLGNLIPKSFYRRVCPPRGQSPIPFASRAERAGLIDSQSRPLYRNLRSEAQSGAAVSANSVNRTAIPMLKLRWLNFQWRSRCVTA